MNLLNLLLPILNVLLGLYQRHLKELDDEKITAIAKNETIDELLKRQAKDELLARRIKGVDGEPRTVTKEDRDWLRNL